MPPHERQGMDAAVRNGATVPPHDEKVRPKHRDKRDGAAAAPHEVPPRPHEGEVPPAPPADMR